MTDRHTLLELLVMDEDLDQLFSLVTLDEIATAWCSYSIRPHDPTQDEDDADWWAVSLMLAREIFQRTDLYRSILLKLVEHADDTTLGNVGAGPLENYVSDNEEDLKWLERECAVNPRLRSALSGVWCADFVSAETLYRLDCAAGVRLARPRPREELPTWVIEHQEAKERLIALAGHDWWQLTDEEMTPAIKEAVAEYLRAEP